jgi:hypothetical protein
MRSGCVDQSWWGGRLACMADSLVKHVIYMLISDDLRAGNGGRGRRV